MIVLDASAMIAFLEQRREVTEQWVARLGLDRREGADDSPAVDLLQIHGTEDDLLAITNFGQKSLDEVLEKLDAMGLSLRSND